ncbi:assimilatory nitrate reductase electron transfer subunit [Streptomyces sp. Amel2xB2]|uniref:NAD(P)/FAD-dependent oxidoreductase n=1 Tax=Streptomyces sp. Amel2xB2 TaxID=1305829 RepID=UPI000DB91589|nr:FAD-dependent oxidoreductase [Streptomyces sp. Amel2xB2]RAJ70119.1 assimilatory nitrate reductase electron transfer subunit [Streptomyces sp. Amel2xB2]
MDSVSRGPRRRVVVIGGGMAGARLAGQLTAADRGPGTGAGLDVTLVGDEPHAPYNRVLLADVLAGRYAPEVVTLPSARTARVLRGVRAVRIDRGRRRVVCEDESGRVRTLAYDVLVLATGAEPALPPLRGLFTSDEGELPAGVRALRTLDDCLALREAARPGLPAVVVGGGPLGVSAARALASRGARVVLAHRGERLLGRRLDADAGELLRRHLEESGVQVRTGCGVRGLCTGVPDASPSDSPDGGRAARTAHAARTVRGVQLADGATLDARAVVLACGVRPRTGLARAAGLDVARGVVVDDALRTSDPRVHAIGDCAEYDGVLHGLAGPAQDQADALARVLLHGARATERDGAAEVPYGTPPPRYRGTRTLTRLTLPAGGPPPSSPPPSPSPQSSPTAVREPQPALDLAAFGDPHPRAGDDVVRLSDATRGVHRQVVVRGGRLAGGVLLGDLTAVGTLARAWEDDEPLRSEPLLHLLTHDGEDPRR